jgi:hypothetical protein
MTENWKKQAWFRRLVRWFFGAPFEELPPELGNPVPPDLRVFEAQAEEAQHHPIGSVASASAHGERGEPNH